MLILANDTTVLYTNPLGLRPRELRKLNCGAFTENQQNDIRQPRLKYKYT